MGRERKEMVTEENRDENRQWQKVRYTPRD